MPGGRFMMQVRAIDPAGNVDITFDKGRNMHVWTYIPRLPIGLIMGLSTTFLIVMAGILIELRRRRKKKPMERYAIKRMRRKFKGIQKDVKKKDVDWRKYYDEAKDN